MLICDSNHLSSPPCHDRAEKYGEERTEYPNKAIYPYRQFHQEQVKADVSPPPQNLGRRNKGNEYQQVFVYFYGPESRIVKHVSHKHIVTNRYHHQEYENPTNCETCAAEPVNPRDKIANMPSSCFHRNDCFPLD